MEELEKNCPKLACIILDKNDLSGLAQNTRAKKSIKNLIGQSKALTKIYLREC